MSMSSQNVTGTQGQFPVDNLIYDLITIMYEKLKGLEALQKYMQDAQSDPKLQQLFQQVQQQDTQIAQLIQQHLQERIGQNRNDYGAQATPMQATT